jgi:hypothetical protein
MEHDAEKVTYPKTSEVLRALADKLDGEDAGLERLQIMQATPSQYVCRLHAVGSEDFEGYFVKLGDPVTTR